MFTKTTHGFVTQYYDDRGECYRQEFIAGDIVEYEQGEEPIDPPDNEKYMPFEMVQPHDFK